jgi:hypothetical protein
MAVTVDAVVTAGNIAYLHAAADPYQYPGAHLDAVPDLHADGDPYSYRHA